MKISEKYTDTDVEFDLIAVKNGIDNKAPRAVLSAATELAENILEPLAEKFEFRILSWFRSSTLEREYCKKSYFEWLRTNRLTFNEASWIKYLSEKQHITGAAVSILSNDLQAVYEYLQNQTFDILQLRDGYIHVSYVKDANRKMILN
jgi:hypothetical protein